MAPGKSAAPGERAPLSERFLEPTDPRALAAGSAWASGYGRAASQPVPRVSSSPFNERSTGVHANWQARMERISLLVAGGKPWTSVPPRGRMAETRWQTALVSPFSGRAPRCRLECESSRFLRLYLT